MRSSQEEEVKELKEKLSKAKAFIKHQDQAFRDLHASREQAGFSEESEDSYRSQISSLALELDRQKVIDSSFQIQTTANKGQV